MHLEFQFTLFVSFKCKVDTPSSELFSGFKVISGQIRTPEISHMLSQNITTVPIYSNMFCRLLTESCFFCGPGVGMDLYLQNGFHGNIMWFTVRKLQHVLPTGKISEIFLRKV